MLSQLEGASLLIKDSKPSVPARPREDAAHFRSVGAATSRVCQEKSLCRREPRRDLQIVLDSGSKVGGAWAKISGFYGSEAVEHPSSRAEARGKLVVSDFASPFIIPSSRAEGFVDTPGGNAF